MLRCLTETSSKANFLSVSASSQRKTATNEPKYGVQNFSFCIVLSAPGHVEEVQWLAVSSAWNWTRMECW